MNLKNLKVGDKIKLVKPLEMAIEFVPNGTIAEIIVMDIEPKTRWFPEMVWITIEYKRPTKYGICIGRANLRQNDLDCGYAIKV